MKYKDYTAIITYDDRDHLFHGHLENTYDDVFFEGTSTEELEQAFQEAVDDYLAYCQETQRPPTKPCSGQVRVRLDPGLHRRIQLAAKRQGLSVSRFIGETLQQTVE